MIDVTRAIALGWVQKCKRCLPIREAAEALQSASLKADGYDSRCRVLGLGHLEFVCEECDGRGWMLTGDGQQLIDLVQELYPELVSKKGDTEVDF